jgi:hypothetical protein
VGEKGFIVNYAELPLLNGKPRGSRNGIRKCVLHQSGRTIPMPTRAPWWHSGTLKIPDVER